MYWDTDFRSASSIEKKTFLYTVKHKDGRSQIEEILAIVVGDSTERKSACSDEEDQGEDEKLVSIICVLIRALLRLQI